VVQNALLMVAPLSLSERPCSFVGHREMWCLLPYIAVRRPYPLCGMQGDKVSGVLDFEFCVYDWRAMEMAVALSK
jgi:hypothetical protein